MTAQHHQPTGVETTDEPAAVNRAQARAFLAARYGRGIDNVALLGAGEWSTAWAFDRDGAERVVRFAATRDDFDKDRLAARFASPILPIPAVLEIGETRGGFYAISERMHGGFIDDLDETGMRAVLPSLVAVLDAARSVDLAAVRGFGQWDSAGSAAHPSWRAALLDVANDRPTDRTHGWRQWLARSPVGSAPFDEGLAALRRLVDACPDERHLIHGDLLNFNVLVAGDRVAAMLDWGCAMVGDGLYDLAWFLFWQPWYPAWHGIDFRQEAARHHTIIGQCIPDFDARLRCYQVHTGLTAQAYNAFRERWPALEETAKRTLEVARGGA